MCQYAGLSKTGVAEAMFATADSITQCKFEATDPASDEVVLYKILQVFRVLFVLHCIPRCPKARARVGSKSHVCAFAVGCAMAIVGAAI